MISFPPTSTLFPYTTLFRSSPAEAALRLPIAAPFPAKPSSGPADRLCRSEGTRLNSSHVRISYAVFCLKKKKTIPEASKEQQNTPNHPRRITNPNLLHDDDH